MIIAIVVGWLLVVGLVIAFFKGSHSNEMHRCYLCHHWYAGPYKEHAGRMHHRSVA